MEARFLVPNERNLVEKRAFDESEPLISSKACPTRRTTWHRPRRSGGHCQSG